ncbi:ABC transporter permease [Microbacterium sp.]|uniref:ABC transporter permease n=1 Tax=Microbacterium sp. TaxID=51671 RepID=UPI00092A04DC|nr:ABC transporter permease [Microbacterium sp.]MBN9180756.1 ABC transporter permease [Microbacterium sp.]MBN9188668.1 ABC transporter permease [Microbacterium sp.]MBN9192186.1 ABC transporter permease [Microbacterium sp.]OJU63573.1 MAG: peptide ABC transporter permease [Microbacterium sp. 70-38]
MTALSTTDIVLSSDTATRTRIVSEGRRRWLRFSANKFAFLGAIFCVLLVLAAVLAPWIAPYPYDKVDYSNIFAPPGTAGHLLGTDNLGRDVLSRLLFSLRTALMIAFAAELAALVLALAIGLAAGYLGGRVDQLLMAGTDIMFAFPSYLFAVILVTVLGRSDGAVIIAIAVGSWVNQARLIRAQVIKMKVQEYVEAGRAMGASSPTLVLRYILPGAWGPMLVATSFGIPAAIMAESGLALLGLGVAPPTPSWGTMIIEGYGQLFNAPYLILAPLILFALTMLAFTWVGDGLRDAFDVNNDGHA